MPAIQQLKINRILWTETLWYVARTVWLNEADVFFALSITEHRGKKWKEFQLRLAVCAQSLAKTEKNLLQTIQVSS